MNDCQLELYSHLWLFAKNGKAFFYKDYLLDDKEYRIFHYRKASYMDFCLPGALECRGIMFEMAQGAPIRLASLPMEKFFNLNENPMTCNLDLDDIHEIALKADGSLMSTFLHYNRHGEPELHLKSKACIQSDMCENAEHFLEQHANLKNDLLELAKLGYTVNLEWCSPEHRIVIVYLQPQLTILNVRSHENGRYLDMHHPHLQELAHVDRHWIDRVPIPSDKANFVASIPDQTEIEGYVITLASGQRTKIKTKWYLCRHGDGDGVLSRRQMYEAAVDERLDDLKALHASGPLTLQLMHEMETLVAHKYNDMVEAVEDYYAQNKHLSMKEYAKNRASSKLDKQCHTLVMLRYNGQDVDYKGAMKKHWKKYI